MENQDQSQESNIITKISGSFVLNAYLTNYFLHSEERLSTAFNPTIDSHDISINETRNALGPMGRSSGSVRWDTLRHSHS